MYFVAKLNAEMAGAGDGCTRFCSGQPGARETRHGSWFLGTNHCMCIVPLGHTYYEDWWLIVLKIMAPMKARVGSPRAVCSQ